MAIHNPLVAGSAAPAWVQKMNAARPTTGTGWVNKGSEYRYDPATQTAKLVYTATGLPKKDGQGNSRYIRMEPGSISYTANGHEVEVGKSGKTFIVHPKGIEERFKKKNHDTKYITEDQLAWMNNPLYSPSDRRYLSDNFIAVDSRTGERVRFDNSTGMIKDTSGRSTGNRISPEDLQHYVNPQTGMQLGAADLQQNKDSGFHKAMRSWIVPAALMALGPAAGAAAVGAGGSFLPGLAGFGAGAPAVTGATAGLGAAGAGAAGLAGAAGSTPVAGMPWLTAAGSTPVAGTPWLGAGAAGAAGAGATGLAGAGAAGLAGAGLAGAGAGIFSGAGGATLGAALGTIAGSALDSSGSKSTNEPWSGQQPYLKDVFSKAQQWHGNAPTADVDPDLANTLYNKAAGELGGSPLEKAAIDRLMADLKYKAQDTNPFLDKMYDRAAEGVTRNFNNAVLPGINATFGGSGRTGGGLHGSTIGQSSGELARELSGLSTDLYGGAYENEMNRAMQRNQFAANMVPGMERSLDVNTADLYPWLHQDYGNLQRYSGLVQQNPLSQGSSKSQTGFFGGLF